MALKGKTVLITGAAGNAGRAVASAFASCGAKLALLDLDKTALSKAFQKDNDSRLLIAADLGDRTAIEAACTGVGRKFRCIDILCNIAGGFHMGEEVHMTSEKVWHHMIDLNAGSVINACAARSCHA